MVTSSAAKFRRFAFVVQAAFASVLARSDLIMTRRVEWANILIGFEQVKLHLMPANTALPTRYLESLDLGWWEKEELLSVVSPYILSYLPVIRNITPLWCCEL